MIFMFYILKERLTTPPQKCGRIFSQQKFLTTFNFQHSIGLVHELEWRYSLSYGKI